ncbi:MAG: hypothetical protein ACQKBU_10810, partial [Verrucomicrobiales bacterium]
TSASEILAELVIADGAPLEDERIDTALHIAEQGLDEYQEDDSLWWLTAQLRYLNGDFAGAVEAGTQALLLAPSWPRLSQTTQAELGLPLFLIEALQEDEDFAVLWSSLSENS